MAEFEDDFEDVPELDEEFVDLEDPLNDIDAASLGDDDDEIPDEDEPAARPTGRAAPGGSRERKSVNRAAQDDVDGVEEDGEEQPAIEEQSQPARSDSDWNRLAYENRKLAQRMDMLLSAIQQAQVQSQPAEEEEAVPDPDEDLGGYLVHGIEKLTKEREQEKQQKQQQELAQRAQQEFVAARNTALSFRESNPTYYDAAVAHLTQTSYEELAEEYPQAAPEQIAGLLAQQAQQRMTTWFRQGRNVGEELVKLAKRRGFTEPTAAPVKQQQPQRVKSPDARTEVQAQKAREQKSRTIAAIPGKAAASKMSSKRLLSLSEDDYEMEVQRLAKTAGGNVSLRDLLKGKERMGS